MSESLSAEDAVAIDELGTEPLGSGHEWGSRHA